MKTYKDLSDVRKHYEVLWKQIKAKYPQASGRICFAEKGEFTNINSGPIALLKENKYVFIESQDIKEALLLIKADRKLAQSKLTDADILPYLKNAHLNPDCRIEIVWSDLDFDLIKALQQDPLIDLTRTPQTAASTRIVLGVIGE